MSVKFFVEGHRPKTSLEDEETLKVKSDVYATLEEATLRAKDILNEDKDLGLAVVYEQNPDGTREGVKFIYMEEDGTFEDFPLYWGTRDTVCEG
jgi:hypothetical protein